MCSAHNKVLVGVTWNVYSYLMVTCFLWHMLPVMSMIVGAVRRGDHIPWIHVFLDSAHHHFGPIKASVRATSNFSCTYVCASRPLPWLCIETEHKFAAAVVVKYVHLGSGKWSCLFDVTYCPLYCLCRQLDGSAGRVAPSHTLETWHLALCCRDVQNAAVA